MDMGGIAAIYVAAHFQGEVDAVQQACALAILLNSFGLLPGVAGRAWVVACRAGPLSDHENLQGQTRSMTPIFNFRSGHCDWKTAGPQGCAGAYFPRAPRACWGRDRA